MIATADAPPTRLLRPLPRPVRPVANETLASFLHRLAAANRLDHDELRSYIAADSHKRARIPLDRLAALSGQPELTLRRAIFDLPPPAGDPTELSWPGPAAWRGWPAGCAWLAAVRRARRPFGCVQTTSYARLTSGG